MYKNCSECQKQFCTQHVLPRFEFGIFRHWACNSMKNLSSYCGLVDAKKELLTKIYLYKLSFDLYFKILLMVYKLNVMAICQMPKYLRFDRTHAKNSSNRQKNIQLDEQWEESQLPPILRVKIIFWSINNRVSKIVEFQEDILSSQRCTIIIFETNFYPYLVVIIVVATTVLWVNLFLKKYCVLFGNVQLQVIWPAK